MADWTLTGTAAAAPAAPAVTTYYSTQTDLQNHFGTDNITKWSNLDNTSTSVNTTRIGLANAYAYGYINDRFRGSKYAIPFTGTFPAVLVVWAARLAAIWLYESRGQSDENEEGNKLEDKREDVDKEISEYLAGQKNFSENIARSHSEIPTAPIALE